MSRSQAQLLLDPGERMAPDLSSFLSALTFSELRTSGVSSDVDADAAVRTFRIDRVELHDIEVRTAIGFARAASVELSNASLRLPLRPANAGAAEPFRGVTVDELRVKGASFAPEAVARRADGAAPRRWRLEPLDALDGTLRAEIVDAAWIFDADVAIPISGGRIDFNRATVEHVGPDSSMGVSPKGVYVDAPNGRTYLFLFSSANQPGARYERRGGALLPSRFGDRGSIDLRPMLEALLLAAAPIGALAAGIREIVARTRVRGDFRLGDGVIGDERRRVVLAGRDSGKNLVALAAAPTGGGIVLRVPELSASELHWESTGAIVSAGAVAAMASVQVDNTGAAPAVSLSIAELTVQKISASAAAKG